MFLIFFCICMNTGEDRRQIIRRLRLRHTSFESSETEDEVDGAILKETFSGIRTKRYPHVHLVVGKLKVRRHHSDYYIATVVKLDALAIQRLIQKMALPEPVTDNGHSIPSGFFVLGQEGAPLRRLRSQQR